MELVRYVALNPVRAGMVDKPGEWPWSSFNAMAGHIIAPPWLTVDAVLADIAKRYPNRNEAMVAAYQTGEYSYAVIAEYFGVHFSTVGRIIRKSRKMQQ